MSGRLRKMVYLTAGAGGMYCGSCMHDNTLARWLTRAGIDVQLVPTYTPIRTDEEDVSQQRVFFGGVNVFLQQKYPWFGRIPYGLRRFLDRPAFLRWIASRAVNTRADDLGALTVAMLQGSGGPLRSEIEKLCGWLGEVQPDLVVLTNMLIGGCIPDLKRLGLPVVATLQGDDIFLESLPEPHRTLALKELWRLVESVDGFLSNSQFYADFMSEYLRAPREKIQVVPLAIDTSDFVQAIQKPVGKHPPTIGYLARLAPEKGLHQLVDAFLRVKRLPGLEQTRFHVAGWLGEHNRPYAEEQFQRIRSAGYGDDFHYAGSVDRTGKTQFLAGIDVLSVPTVYRDPKGLFVLEAMAAGVPVVQPAHGAFPELLQATGGGRLVPPGDVDALATALAELLRDEGERLRLGGQGRESVLGQFHGEALARNTIAAFERLLGAAQSSEN